MRCSLLTAIPFTRRQVLLDKHMPVHAVHPAEEEPAVPHVPPGRPRGLVNVRPPPPPPPPPPEEPPSPPPEALMDTTEFLVVKQPPPPDSLHCRICKMVFVTEEDLREHEKAHETVSGGWGGGGCTGDEVCWGGGICFKIFHILISVY